MSSPGNRLSVLDKVMARELAMNCRNQSVFGGFDHFLDKLLDELAAHPTRDPAALDEARALAIRYARSTPDRRRQILVALRARLRPGAPPPGPEPAPPPEPQPPARSPQQEAPPRREPPPRPEAPPPRTRAAARATSEDADPAEAASPVTLDTQVQFLRGIGPKRAGLLERLDIRTVRDLCWHLPFRYEDRSDPRPLASLEPGKWQAFRARVTRKSSCGGWGRGRVTLTVEDASGSAVLTWFGSRHVAAAFTRGDEYHFFARPALSKGKLTIANPDFEAVSEDAPPTGHVPVYPNTSGMTQRFLRRQVGAVAARFHEQFPELLPADLVTEKQLPSRASALLTIHRPPDPQAAEAARRRLAYEELLVIQLALGLRRRRNTQEVRGVVCPDARRLFDSIEERLPFRYTPAQRRVLADIRKDLAGSRPMARLLQGDVGSGKTVVALTALLAACGDGFQGAIMAPTEILAEQHHLSLTRTAREFGVECALIVGAQTRRERAAALEGLRAGRTGIAIGTHALFESGVDFHALGLVVVDEQHRFGVVQRDRLVAKGQAPNVLVMTATPIPRTLALTLYGDLDVSVLDQLPPGRQPITTRWVKPARLDAVWAGVEAQLGEGRQAYVVCPLVEESGDLKIERENAQRIHERLSTGPFAHRRVGLLHGQMKSSQKDAVMSAFRAAELDLLVATTVVEVGVDVPNATAMVILDADAFGLAQLHQLRGRIGRGPGKSSCWLVAHARGQLLRARLAAMVGTQDGFRIAQADLEQRGPGELIGTRQAGLPNFRVAQLARDLALLEEACADAKRMLAADPDLTTAGRERLREAAEERYRAFIVH